MSVLSVATQQQVENDLIGEGVLSSVQLKSVQDKVTKSGGSVFGTLVSDRLITNEQLTKAIAQATKVPYVNLNNVTIDPKVLDLLPLDIAERYMAVPIGEMQHRLVIAMLDADNVQAVDFLSNKIGRPLKVYVASEEGISNIISQYPTHISETVEGQIGQFEKDAEVEHKIQSDSKTNHQNTARNDKNIKTLVQDSPISKALSAILEYAARNNASDVHIEPLEDSLKIRCRVDGILREVMQLPKSSEPPLISRIKILSNLKIDEHRIPQDGEFSIFVAEKDIDLRVAISPVVWGEQVVIRLLDKSSTNLKLEEMGYRGRALRLIREGLKQTNGMILTSGPTGSGKSTSLYALIQEIKNDAINIVTLEDPVEYKMPGVNQIQVNPDVGLTFATGLRSILRQDPDVVMVGEIRDKETADLAVQAALTGHLVFSTLHTNSAGGILPRLLDMGIEPFLIASTVKVVIGQRLVRRVTLDQEEYQSSVVEAGSVHSTLGNLLPASDSERKAFSEDLGYDNLPLATQNAYTLTKGKDSPRTPGGYSGRMGVYETFRVSNEIQDLILKQASSNDIQKLAQTQGMITMRQDGYLKALTGLTTLNEVNRVAAADIA
ncbi:MAG: GspE/PulE family protein [Candidatus Saccharimonadales bacterium]